MDNRFQAGFTLYELLITVVVVGVILTFAVPNLQDFARNSRMTGAANDLLSIFHVARSESSRAKSNITICPSGDGKNCGTSWNDGYIMFVDENGDLARSGPTDSVLRMQGSMASGVSLAVAGDATYFSYSSTGLGRPNVNGETAVSQIVICDQRGNIVGPGGSSAARLLVVTPLGRATIIRDVDLIDDALTNMNKTCP